MRGRKGIRTQPQPLQASARTLSGCQGNSFRSMAAVSPCHRWWLKRSSHPLLPYSIWGMSSYDKCKCPSNQLDMEQEPSRDSCHLWVCTTRTHHPNCRFRMAKLRTSYSNSVGSSWDQCRWNLKRRYGRLWKNHLGHRLPRMLLWLGARYVRRRYGD